MSDGFPGLLGQLSTAIANGATVTQLNVSRTQAPIQKGAPLIIGYWLGALAPGYQVAFASQTVQSGAELIPVTSFTAAAAFPIGTAIASMPQMQWNWLDGIGQPRPQAGTPHPYHVGGSYSEVAIPQDLTANSAPAAGSTASLVLTNPGTTLQSLITITGMTAGLINSTVASAGQINTLRVTGSIGGQYTAEPLSVAATAFLNDRLVYRGQQLVTGNGIGTNFTENFTCDFAVAGIANLFQRINPYYHFGA